MNFPKIPPIAITVICVMAAPAAHANLITNGNFELPGVPSSSPTCGTAFNTDCQGYYSHDQTNAPLGGPFDIAGWAVIGKAAGVDANANPFASVLQLGDGYTEGALQFHAQDGTQSLDLTGEGNQGANGIRQSFSSAPGGNYVISFYLGHQDSREFGYAGSSLLDLYIDGSLAQTFSNLDIVSKDVAWDPFQFAFTATSGLTTIAFINATSVGNNYTGLDNVVLAAIPEPDNFALFGLGFGGLLMIRRRKVAPN